ncbi:integrase domain-containing protein [Vibrio parahaemolyticus]|nr:tyrosine-type recombinase/integrase [Vibrio parahaemolyticus]HCG8096429.1 tyrosine-type recombinase/integrase [Vibrio parahaemolyticus]HCH6157465.1 tyrosine-type recombinase/integrase [Vibrio parahaemolyticus]HCH6159638.1 tyrosine-type recombinase/integrase [Vibrio parahaemolyticus]
MAKTTQRLTPTQIKNAKAEEKETHLYDGDGLKLRISPNGTKSWLLNYYRPTNGKRANLALGKYPDLSLANARKKALEARELVAQGIDPKEFRDQKKAAQVAISEHTLFYIATEWFEIKKETITPDYAKDIWRSLEMYVFPKIGEIPISHITAPLVIELLKPVEAKGSLETVKRIAQRLNELMNYATNCGFVPANPLTGIKAAFKKPKKESMAALKPDELPELMNAIANASIKRTTRCLIEWQLHTMTRPSEAAGVKWDEVNLETRVWTIPAERMKKRREHRIPLTDEACCLLEVMRPISGSREFIFPSDRDPKKPCNSQSANMALKRMGFANRLVSHGLRSLASTTLNEQGFESDLIESALAHVDDNQVRSAYNRTDYLERRIPMMSWWSKHIIKASQGNLSLTGYKGLKAVG